MVLGIVALGWALLILLCPFPQLHDEDKEQEARPMPAMALLGQGTLITSIVAQFFYVGAQVGTWSDFICYVQDYSGQGEKVGYSLTGTLCMFAGGRFISAWLMKFVAPARLMAIYSAINMLLVGVGTFMPGWIGIWAIFF
jgi:MFS transporter, FHS family, L-fucose permease